MKGVTSVVGAVATDMGILTTPQLHWMVRARNKGMQVSEQDYFEQLSSSFRSDQCRHCYGSRWALLHVVTLFCLCLSHC